MLENQPFLAASIHEKWMEAYFLLLLSLASSFFTSKKGHHQMDKPTANIAPEMRLSADLDEVTSQGP